jgi:hypothetical protein
MKKIVLISLSLTVLLCCSKNNNDILTSDIDTIITQSMNQPFSIKTVGYPILEASLMDCIPINYDEFELKKDHDLVGKINHSGKDYNIVGSFNIFECELNENKTMLTEKFSGVGEDSEGDLLFYSGYITILIASSTINGEMNFNNGTGKYSSSKGFIATTGSVNYENGMLTLKGEGSILINN